MLSGHLALLLGLSFSPSCRDMQSSKEEKYCFGHWGWSLGCHSCWYHRQLLLRVKECFLYEGVFFGLFCCPQRRILATFKPFRWSTGRTKLKILIHGDNTHRGPTYSRAKNECDIKSQGTSDVGRLSLSPSSLSHSRMR